MNWKFYADYVNKNPPYCGIKDKKQTKSRRRKMKRFKKKWGFDYSETWNLDHTIVCFILPRLAYLRDNKTGWAPAPEDFAEDGTIINEKESLAKYNKKLDIMIEGFYLYLTKEQYKWTVEEQSIWQQTKELFIELLPSLWD